MPPRTRLLAIFAIMACAALNFAGSGAFADGTTVSPQGMALAKVLDSSDVEHLWIAGAHVNWETGVPDGVAEVLPGKHTHCSAFAASVAKRLGVYILRPPEHRQVLLANAQNEWLQADEGQKAGWQPLPGAVEAQAAADAGELVVASYHNHHDDKPGHTAIVRPGTKTPTVLASEGPDVIQAGSTNSRAISLKGGFAGHPAAWRDKEVLYFAHPVAWPVN